MFILFSIENHWNPDSSYLFLHNKFHPKQLKTIHTYYLIILSIRNLGGLCSGPGPRSLMRLPSGSRPELPSHMEARLGEDPLLSSLTSASIPPAIGHWHTSVSCHVDLSIGQLITWNLASFRATEPENRRKHPRWKPYPFGNLISEVTSYHFCCILFI